MNSLLRITETVVAGLLLYSGLLHTSNPYLFANAVAAYRLLPMSLLSIIPFVLPHVMIVLGICLIAQIFTTPARCGAAILFFVFAVAQSVVWISGGGAGCGCFGYANEPISPKSIAVPVVCALVCTGLLWSGRSRQPSSRTQGHCIVEDSKTVSPQIG